MASVHIRKDKHDKPLSKYYRATFAGPDGKWVYRSTRKANKKEAQAIADEWEREALRVTGADEDTQRELLRLLHSAIIKGTRGELSIDVFRETLEQAMEVVGHSGFQAHTVREWVEHWMEERSAVVETSTRKDHARMANRLFDALGADADLPLMQFNEDHVRAFRADLDKDPTKGATKNIYLDYLKGCIADAETEGRIKRNVVKAVPRFPTKDSVEKLPFNVEEIRKLYQAAEGEYRGWILIAYHTGMRAGDCAKLRWRSVDLAEETIIVQTTKSKKRVIIPIHPQLKEYLESLPSTDDPEAFVLPKLALKKKNNLSAKFSGTAASSIMNLASVPKTAFIGEVEGSRTFHSLRHSHISQLHDLGIPEEDIMAASAHSSKAVHDAYNHSMGEMKTRIKEVPTI